MKYILSAVPLAVVLFAADVGAQTLENADVTVRAEPVRESLFGMDVDDPYRWMESAERAGDVDGFIRQSGAHLASQLAAMPGRARLRERTAAAFAAGTQYGDPQMAGGRLFFLRTSPGAQFGTLVARDAGGGERILHDPEVGEGAARAISSYRPSPGGRLVAFHLSGGGSEVGAIHILDVETGALLPDRVGPVWGQIGADWIDDRTLIVTRMASEEGGDPLRGMQAMLYRIGDGAGPVLLGSEAVGAAFAEQEIPQLFAAPGSEWIIGLGMGARADQRVLVARRADVLAGRPAWREIAAYADEIGDIAGPVGDHLYLLSSKGASNRRVLRVDLAAGDRLNDAETVVPAGEAIITAIAAMQAGLYVAAKRDGLSELSFRPGGTGPAVAVDLPLSGTIAALRPLADQSGLSFMMQDWLTAPRWFRAEGAKIISLGLDGAGYAPARQWTQRSEQATSADGTRVPMAILLPSGAERAAPPPLLLQGYGGYGVIYTEPRYVPQHFGFIEEGGAVAFCGTRGGGERGRAWHDAGRGANKPNAHADLIACGERLVELGLTAPGRMSVLGGSAGGMLAPPAALKRPDLFRSMIAGAAILNPVRLAVASNGPNQFAEMGDPGTEAGFRALLLADAYQMLASAKDMPDTLLVVGLNDNRVAPWFSAKFAARARDLFGDSRLVLIRTDAEAGHGIGSASDVMIDMHSDIGAFVLNRAGAEGFADR